MNCTKSVVILFFVLAAFFYRAAITSAAGPPEAGTIQQEIEKQIQKQQPPSEAPAPGVQPPPPLVKPGGPKILVKGFLITGSKLFTEEQLKPLLAGFIGKELTLSDLEEAASAITDFYRNKGYIVRAYVPQQEVKDGIVHIVVVEGKLEGVDIDETTKSRLGGERARNYILAAQPVGEPISIPSLERGLLLLNDLPGVSATSILQPGKEEGTSRLLLKVENTPLFTGGTSYNNGGQRFTGSNQAIAFANANNITGIGDQLSLTGLHSEFDGTDFISGAYSLPIGYSGFRLGALASGLKYKLGRDFLSLDAHGSAETYEVNASYPFIRSRSVNLNGTVAYDHKRYLNESLDLVTSNNVIDVGAFGLKGSMYDQFMGGGFTTAGVTLYTGSLQLGNDPANKGADEQTARTEGQYVKVGWNASRLQTIYARTSLYLSLSGQFAGKNLDSSEKFILGGPYGVRAYPVNEAPGDEGVLATLELRQTLITEVQVLGFLDYGHVVLHHTLWPGSQGATNTPNVYDLAGGGPGINVALSKLKLNGTFNVAWPIGPNMGHDVNGNDNDGTHRRPRFWVSVQKYF